MSTIDLSDELISKLGGLAVTDQLDSLIEQMESAKLANAKLTESAKLASIASSQAHPEDTIQSESRLYNLLPLEVANYFCKTYFDDEDFIYVRLELPDRIISQGSHHGNGREDLIEFLANAERPLGNGEIFNKLATLYQYVIGYYNMQDMEAIPPDSYWPSDFLQLVVSVCMTITGNCDMDITTPGYDYLNAYNREVFYGLGLIIQQIRLISLYYGLGASLAQFKDRHAIRFIRLVNNLCVIMIYVNYYFDEFEELHTDYPHIPDEWRIRTNGDHL
jgi:hypothetical protein